MSGGLSIIVITLSADVKPTEDVEKVQQAIHNICPIAETEIIESANNVTLVKGRAKGPEAIKLLARKFRDQRILEAVRHCFLKNMTNNALIFGLHRQAAFMGRFHLSDLDDVSAMGPICVEIQAKNLQDVIDYISPPTIKGKPRYRKDLQLE